MQNKLKILIIGSGGREHAVGWKISQSRKAGQIYFAPGNGGTGKLGVNVAISATDISKLLDFAKREKIDLTLALPDDPLAMGIVNVFQSHGLRIWGPTREAAELEWSKTYAKNFMRRHGLPTARFETFTDFETAKEYVRKHSYPVVLKASGLALGKGVIIAETIKHAEIALEEIMVKKVFGESGSEVVIEEFLTGRELSVHAFCDGKNYKLFPIVQDHKKIGEGNTGANTGGMGVVGPIPFIDSKLLRDIEEKIVAPTIKAMLEEGRPFVGVLYPGLMLTDFGPKILEFNARLGDPETQVYMRLLETDLLEIISATLEKKLIKQEIKWKNSAVCNIVLAASGYPGMYEKGKEIKGIDAAELDKSVIVFQAGTQLVNNSNLLTSGGRVMGISALGDTLSDALDHAYKAIEKISFAGMQYRKDIGKDILELKG